MNTQNMYEAKNIPSEAFSSRRSVQFLAALYIHTLVLLIFAVFSRNVFSATIRTVLLPLLR